MEEETNVQNDQDFKTDQSFSPNYKSTTETPPEKLISNNNTFPIVPTVQSLPVHTELHHPSQQTAANLFPTNINEWYTVCHPVPSKMQQAF